MESPRLKSKENKNEKLFKNDQDLIELNEKIEKSFTKYGSNCRNAFQEASLNLLYKNFSWHIFIKKMALDFIVFTIYEAWTIGVIIGLIIDSNSNTKEVVIITIAKALHLSGLGLYFFACNYKGCSLFITLYFSFSYSSELVILFELAKNVNSVDSYSFYAIIAYAFLYGAALINFLTKLNNFLLFSTIAYGIGQITVLVIYFVFSSNLSRIIWVDLSVVIAILLLYFFVFFNYRINENKTKATF